MLSLVFPFSLLSLLGRTFRTISCVGLTQRQANVESISLTRTGTTNRATRRHLEEQTVFEDAEEMRALTKKLKETDFD